jgi:hypothetical protein
MFKSSEVDEFSYEFLKLVTVPGDAFYPQEGLNGTKKELGLH